MKFFREEILLSALCALLCLAVAACSKADEPEVGGAVGNEIIFEPDDDIISIPAEGGAAVIAVSTSVDWDVVSDQEWCLASRDEFWFTVSAEANTTDQTRQASVDVTSSVGSDGIVRSFRVIQESLDVPDTGSDDSADLSQSGTANCYLVAEAGRYRFDATTRGNGAGTDGLAAPEPLDGAQAGIVWQSSRDLIEDVSLEDGQIVFTITGSGNALLCLGDGAGNILWSWHIWFPETVPSDLHVRTGHEVMDMNLGAMNASVADAGSYGMLYQWGRKDPFPAAATLTGDTATVGATLYDAEGGEVTIGHTNWYGTENNTIEYSIANPTVCISNNAQYSSNRDWLASGTGNDALWGNPLGDKRDENNDYPNGGVKTFYDPCPVGYRVPPADVFRTFTSSGGYAWTLDDFDVADLDGDGEITSADFSCGWIFNLDEGVTSWFPAAARYDGSYAMLMGSVSGLWGSYWGNAPYTSSTDGMGWCVLSFQAASVSPAGGGSRADAYSVRCVRE